MADEYDPYLVVTSDEAVFREALRARDLFPRDDSNTCVICEINGKLTCDASCEEKGWECKQVVKVDTCKECPSTKCVPPEETTDLTQSSVTGNSSSKGPSVGVIVGAVIGGLVGIAAITFLIWRFCIKGKRQAEPVVTYDEVSEEKMEADRSFQSRRDQRSSMHTVHSIASTVLTRASNIIQIAYIPGVTNRAGPPSSPNVLVPPVPPIPITVTDANSPSPYEEQHFFMPRDLRDSTCSAMSGYTDRTSMARTSYAPRSSIASTFYGGKGGVVVSTPQTAMMVKPGVVSVRSGHASNGSATPPVPSINEKYKRNSMESTWSIGETYTKNATATATQIQGAKVVRVGSGKTVNVRGSKSDSGDSTTPSVRSPLARESSAPTIIEDDDGPFSDPTPPAERRSSHKSNKSLSAVIEEATRRAAQVDKSKRLSRETSPFGDEHATKD